MLGFYKRGLAFISVVFAILIWYQFFGQKYIQDFISTDLKMVALVIILLVTAVPLLLGWLMTKAVEVLQ